MRSASRLLALLFAGGVVALATGEAALADQQEEAVRYRFLSDGQAEEFALDIDGAQVAFRNDAHDLVVYTSLIRSRTGPQSDGSGIDTLVLDIETGARSVRWQIVDRNHAIARYRIANLVTREDGALAIFIQRQGNDGPVLSSVMVLHSQMDDQEMDLPDYSGAMWDKVGDDIDGDGSLELLVPDSRFLDAFGPGGHGPSLPLGSGWLDACAHRRPIGLVSAVAILRSFLGR